MKTTNFILTLAAAIFLQTIVSAQPFIQVQNKLKINRTELISISYQQFTKHFDVDSNFTIYDKENGNIYLHQLEKLGSQTPQHVLIQIPIASKAKIKLVAKAQKAPSQIVKTFARYVPERFDDYAWENDRVAFRLYGKALEGRHDDAQGMDYWAKRTDKLIINSWYKGEDYHTDHGEGLDYYAVGQTLGAGDIAFYYNDKVLFTKHYRGHSLLDNGPLRTTFKLTYEEQDINGNAISFTKTISLDAGEHFNRVTLDFDNKSNSSSSVVAGLVKRNEDNPEYVANAKQNYLVYWEPDVNNHGRTGTALLFPYNKVDIITDEKIQFLLKTRAINHKPLTYYNGAAWDRAKQFSDLSTWAAHVDEKNKRLASPLTCKFKK